MRRTGGQQAAHHNEQKVHVLIAFVHLVQDDMREARHRLGADQLLQQDAGGAEQQPGVVRQVGVQTHLEANDAAQFPFAFRADSVRDAAGRNAPWLGDDDVAGATSSNGVVENELRNLGGFAAAGGTCE